MGPGSSAVELAAAIRSRELSPLELIESCLRRTEETEPSLHAFLTLAPERALEEAKAATEVAQAGGELPPLHGLPVGVKDLQQTAGVRTTFGSLVYEDHVPREDCVAVARLREAGAIVVGKTNTPFIGMLGETKNRLGPDCRNPWDLERTPGGSSGGSAAALAAGVVPLATGTDSAGSITVPSGYTGVFGLKPSHGRVPMVPSPGDSLFFNDSGPMTRSPADAALMLGVMAGFDARDPMALREEVPDFAAAVAAGADGERPLGGMRVAHTPDLGLFRVDRELREATAAVARRFEELGAAVEEAAPRLPDPFEIYMPLYVTDLRSAFGDRLAQFDADLYPETREELGMYPPISGEEYVKVLNRLWRFQATAADFFADFDLLLMPCNTTTAFPLGEPPEEIDGEPVSPLWMTFMPFQISWNMTGQPTAALPSGVSADGLPMGTLMAAGRGREVDLLRAAAAFERVQPFEAPR
jgi:Asp-tRNA(Asn)/Glu-tRNA(Gln) amidotransferase A subunit family amidase